MKPALSEKQRVFPSHWHQFNQGDVLARVIGEQLQPWWQRIFGYYMLKVGDLSCQLDTRACKVQHHINVGMYAKNVMVQAYADALPFSDASVDAVLLSHNLEFTHDPHHVVREAHRVMRSDGYLIMTGVNPYSLVGVLKCWPPLQRRFPWQGRFFSLARVKDWLHLVGFDVLAEQHFFCSAMLTKEHHQGRLQQFSERYLHYFGASYLLIARKRELPLTPMRPKWQLNPTFEPQVKGVSARHRS